MISLLYIIFKTFYDKFMIVVVKKKFFTISKKVMKIYLMMNKWLSLATINDESLYL